MASSLHGRQLRFSFREVPDGHRSCTFAAVFAYHAGQAFPVMGASLCMRARSCESRSDLLLAACTRAIRLRHDQIEEQTVYLLMASEASLSLASAWLRSGWVPRLAALKKT